jgi:hypothetical protein
MPYHVIVALGDGRTACADHRDPIAQQMHRIHRAMTESRPGPADAYAAVAEWLDDPVNAARSERCRAGLKPGGDCGHD